MNGPGKPPGLVLFDFDGTVADTGRIILDATNALANEFGFQPITHDELPTIRAMDARELLTRRLGIRPWNVPKVRRLERRAREEYRDRADAIEVFEGIEDAIVRLRALGFGVALLTSNDSEVVRRTLASAGLPFDFTESGSRALGKVRALRAALRTHRLRREEVVYVGDELRDVEACRSAGIAMVGVAWGLGHPGALRASGIEVATSPADLPDLVARALTAV